MDDDAPIDHTLLINRSVKVYRIPPRSAAGGHRSGEWHVSDEIFAGRLRVVARGENLEIRIEDASTGELFASCPCTPSTQAVAVEPAADSSRYYVLRVEDPTTRRHAFLGLGFAERGEAFDFNAALADHAKQCQRESMLSQQQQQQAPLAAVAAGAGSLDTYSKLDEPPPGQLFSNPGDLSLKEGQTIKIEIHKSHKPGGFLSRSSGGGAAAAAGSSNGSLLPPPVLPPPPLAAPSPARAAPAPAASAAVTVVASQEENWATFD